MEVTFKVWNRIPGEKRYSFQRQFEDEVSAENYIIIESRTAQVGTQYQIQRVRHWFDRDEEFIAKKITKQLKKV